MVAASGLVVVFLMLAILALVIMVISKVVSGIEGKKPAAAPASMAAGKAKKGCPARAMVADTAAPRVKAPLVVMSAMFSTRKLRNRARATRE